MTTTTPPPLPSTKPAFDFTSYKAWTIFCAVILTIAVFSERAAKDTTNSPSTATRSSCSGEPAKCASPAQFVKDNERLFHDLGKTCQVAFERNARYEVKWAHYQNFTEYAFDQSAEMAAGDFIMGDTKVKVQNGLGSFANGQAQCTINIASGRVSQTRFYPN